MKNHLAIASAFVPMFAVALGLNAAVVPTGPANAQTPTTSGATLSTEGMQAFRTLEQVESFALGGVGIAMRPLPGETALRVLLKEKNGPVVLRGLFKTAKPAGKLYALVGLKQTGTPRDVSEVADGLRKRNDRVKTIRGCIGGSEAVATLATQIENGKLVLPKERIERPAK